jgi:hypothetical protein
MPSIYNDGTLVRGSILLTINSVVYTLLNYSRTRGAPRVELDYDYLGKPAGSTVAEDFERITGTIRVRSDKVAPPKGTMFTYDSKNWQVIDRVESGSTEGLKEYAVEILEVINGSVTTS